MLLVAVSDRYKERFSSGNSKMVYLQNVQIRLLHIQKVLSILDAFVARGKFYFFSKKYVPTCHRKNAKVMIRID